MSEIKSIIHLIFMFMSGKHDLLCCALPTVKRKMKMRTICKRISMERQLVD